MPDINATDLPQETTSTLDGTEQFVMFDLASGKRASLADIKDYIFNLHFSDDGDGNITITKG